MLSATRDDLWEMYRRYQGNRNTQRVIDRLGTVINKLDSVIYLSECMRNGKS